MLPPMRVLPELRLRSRWHRRAVPGRAAALVAGVLGAGALLTGCGGGEPPGEDAAVQVVAGFYPLAFAAAEVGGAGVSVENLTPAGAEPHDLELSARDVERVRAADLVLSLGGFQPALEDAARESDVLVDLLESVALLEGGDPHVWLDPVRYAQIGRQLGMLLGAEPAAARFSERLAELDAEFARGLEECARRTIVTSHEAFAYLADRYALEQVAIAGLAPEGEPAAGDVERVVELVRASGASTVFVEPLVSPQLAETVARETGAAVATLDPLEGLTEDQVERGEDYFSVMRANLEALREGLECS
jgi:zinc transport system substrate-binding protein